VLSRKTAKLHHSNPEYSETIETEGLSTVHILEKAEVAQRLGITESSLSSQMVRNPCGLPAWFKRPGGKKPLWFAETVDAFLYRCAAEAGALPGPGWVKED